MDWKRGAAAVAVGAVTFAGLALPVSAARFDGSQELTRFKDGQVERSGCKLVGVRAGRAPDKKPRKRYVQVTVKLECDTAYDRGHWGFYMHGGTSYAHPKDWHRTKAVFKTGFGDIGVGSVKLHARAVCNYKPASEWVYPTTGYNIFAWAEVHSPIHAPLSERYKGTLGDEIEGETC